MRLRNEPANEAFGESLVKARYLLEKLSNNNGLTDPNQFKDLSWKLDKLKQEWSSFLFNPPNSEIYSSREMNKFVYNFLELLSEIEIDEAKKAEIETQIAVAEVFEAMETFLELSKGTDYYLEVVHLSFRLNSLKKDLNTIKKGSQN